MANPRIYMDSCCLIESLKGDAGKSAPNRAVGLDFIKRLLMAARDDKVTIFTSMLTVSEVVKAGDAPIDDDFKRKVERLILSGRDGLTTVGLNPAIVLRARDLAWNDGLRSVAGADRVHVASALVAGATDFLSWDNRLGKKAERGSVGKLSFLEPALTQVLPDDYRSDDLFEKAP